MVNEEGSEESEREKGRSDFEASRDVGGNEDCKSDTVGCCS